MVVIMYIPQKCCTQPPLTNPTAHEFIIKISTSDSRPRSCFPPSALSLLKRTGWKEYNTLYYTA